MKRKRFILLGFVALLFIGYILSIIPNFSHRAEWKRTVTALQSLPHDRLQTAVQSFIRDRSPTDSTVPLRELVLRGYLGADEVASSKDMDVAVALAADETTPDVVWIRVRAADGSDIVLMTDGRIERVARR